MKLYKDIYDIPINRLQKIQESILKEEPDYSSLIKSGWCFNKKKLNKQYIELLYQFPDIDIELKKSFLEYHLQMQVYITREHDINETRETLGLKPLINSKYPANTAFKAYFKKLQEDYTDFEFEICFLNPKLKLIYEKVTGNKMPDGFNYNLEFFFIDEFMKYIYSFDDIEFQIAMFAGYDTFVKSEKRLFAKEIYSIEQINERLDKFFREAKQYEKWFLIRYNYFNLKKLDFRAEEQQTILNDVITLSRILGQDIDTETVTVGQLYSTYKESADKVIQNKPKAAGHAG